MSCIQVIAQFFTTTKCKHTNLLLRATCKSELFVPIYFVHLFWDPKNLKNVCDLPYSNLVKSYSNILNIDLTKNWDWLCKNQS